MEVEQLVGWLRNMLGWFDEQVIRTYGRKRFDDSMTCPIQLDRHRTIATACKILASDPTIPDGQRLAGVIMQLTGAGDAKPYEVEE